MNTNALFMLLLECLVHISETDAAASGANLSSRPTSRTVVVTFQANYDSSRTSDVHVKASDTGGVAARTLSASSYIIGYARPQMIKDLR